jgi:predicted DNA-binding transcriptional regulator YafY
LESLLGSERESEPFVCEHLESWTCGIKKYDDYRQHLVLLVEAILRRRRCRVVYQKPSSTNPKSYDFDPYRLLLVDGGLCIIGKVPKYEDIATLSLDRLLSVVLTSIQFEVIATFDPKRYRQQAFGVSWQDPQQIVLRFRADEAPYVRERIWHPTQQLRLFPDGTLEMSFQAGGPFEIRRWILGWGDAVEVIAPESMRKEVQRVD